MGAHIHTEYNLCNSSCVCSAFLLAGHVILPGGTVTRGDPLFEIVLALFFLFFCARCLHSLFILKRREASDKEQEGEKRTKWKMQTGMVLSHWLVVCVYGKLVTNVLNIDQRHKKRSDSTDWSVNNQSMQIFLLLTWILKGFFFWHSSHEASRTPWYWGLIGFLGFIGLNQHIQPFLPGFLSPFPFYLFACSSLSVGDSSWIQEERRRNQNWKHGGHLSVLQQCNDMLGKEVSIWFEVLSFDLIIQHLFPFWAPPTSVLCTKDNDRWAISCCSPWKTRQQELINSPKTACRRWDHRE